MSAIKNWIKDFLKEKLPSSFKGLKEFLKSIPKDFLLNSISLFLIVLIAVLIRLMPLRWGFFLSEFDPYMQYRMVDYIAKNGYISWFNWHDSMSWYPWGRDIPTTTYPGLAFTTVILYKFLSSLGLNVTAFQVSVIFPVIMGAISCIAIYVFAKEIWGRSVALFSALFLAFSTSHISRTSIGFFDDETIGIFAMLLVFTFYLRSISKGRSLRSSIFYALLSGLSLAYLSCSWGAFRYPLALIAIFSALIAILGKYSRKLLMAFIITISVEFVLISQLPYIGYAVFTEWSTLLVILGTLIVLLFYEIFMHVKKAQLRVIIVLGFIGIAISSMLFLWKIGIIGSPESKFVAILIPQQRLQMPLIESVAEHRPATWASFFYEYGILIILGIFGIIFPLQRFKENDIFIVLFCATALYFAASLVRLTLILAPAVSVVAAIGIVELSKPSLDVIREAVIFPKRKLRLPRVGREFGVAILLILIILTLPTLNASMEVAYSPTTIATSSLPVAPRGEEANKYQDWLQALVWMKENLPKESVVMSWWDYGYWITAISEKRTLADNGTINSTQIAMIARAFLSNETFALPIMKRYNVTHVAIFVTFVESQGRVQFIGFGEDNKWLWMARIGNNSIFEGSTIRFLEKHIEDRSYYLRTIEVNGKIIANDTIAEAGRLGDNSILGKLMLQGIGMEVKEPSPFFNLLFFSRNRYVLIYKVIYPAETNVTLSLSKNKVQLNESVVISGKLTDIFFKGVANASVHIYYSLDEGKTWEELSTAITNIDGTYSLEWAPYKPGSYLIQARFEGIAPNYSKSISQAIRLEVTKPKENQ
ncbi:MAG: STT3 domain-containing protein [Candidatus Bathyarchaeia archaeon]